MKVLTSHISSLDDRLTFVCRQGMRKQVEVCTNQPYPKFSSSRNKDFFTVPRIVTI